jgi:hypothetical protein
MKIRLFLLATERIKIHHLQNLGLHLNLNFILNIIFGDICGTRIIVIININMFCTCQSNARLI